MKKMFLTISLVALACLAFGQDYKTGVGLAAGFVADNQSFKQWLDSPAGQNEVISTNNSYSIGAFVDFQFVEASLALVSQLGDTKIAFSSSGVFGSSSDSLDVTTEYLSISGRVLGKFPFAVGSFTLFPVAGLEYSMNIGMSADAESFGDGFGEVAAEYNDLFVDLGAGADFPITDTVFVRAEAIYGLNLTPTIKNVKDGVTSPLKYSDFGYRLNASVGVGFKL